MSQDDIANIDRIVEVSSNKEMRFVEINQHVRESMVTITETLIKEGDHLSHKSINVKK